MFHPAHGDPQTFRWADGDLETLKQFRQGDVILDASLAYSTLACAPITTLVEPGGEQRLIGVRADLAQAMITSQTCDLAGDRSKNYPLCMVAPVYNIAPFAPAGDLGNIRADRVGQLIVLDGPTFTGAGEVWVADLRFEVALEKSVVAQRDRIIAFSTEDGYLRCSRKIARARRRAAIDDRILKHVLRPLESALGSGAIPGDHIADILVKATPSTVNATAARLFVLVDDPAEVKALQNLFDEWHVEIAPKLPAGLTFLGADVRTEDRFTWTDYRGAEIVDFSRVSPEAS